MHRSLVVSLAGFVLVSVSAFVAAQDFCDKQFVVSQVTLPATTHLSRSEQATIRARLIGRCLDEQQLDELAGQVRSTLQSFGYLHATVSEPAMTIADARRHPQTVLLNVGVEEGAHYKVREIEWWNLKAVSFDQVTSVSPIQVEDFLDMGKVRETVETVRRLYAANGYSKASIVPQVRFLGSSGVSVHFKVVEGAQSP